MAKRVDPLKAKAAKQKKIAIGLCLFLVLVLAYQGPKTLKMLKGPSAVAAVTDGTDPTALPAGVEAAPPTGVPLPTTGTPVAGAPAVPDPATTADPTDAGSQPAVLANSDLPVTAGEGQLLSFEQFASKDPFKQQATVTGDPDTDIEGAAPPAVVEPTQPADGSAPGSAENPPLSTGGIGGSGSPGGSEPPAAATDTTISVNGVVLTVTVGKAFPEDQPTFELVSSAKDGKSVQIGVAGGKLAAGGPTVKLTLGKLLTLQNTADGSLYKLKLLTVAGFVTPTSKG